MAHHGKLVSRGATPGTPKYKVLHDSIIGIRNFFRKSRMSRIIARHEAGNGLETYAVLKPIITTLYHLSI